MTLSRRDFVFATTVLSVNSQPILAKNKPSTMQTKTQIAITYGLELSRHFPNRGMTLGDFQKGILDSATKSYTLAAGKIAAQRGVRLRFYDNQGYDALRDFLKTEGIRHVLLLGYATDMCVSSTTAGYENLRRDFNVFLVGDATQATLPANKTAAHATNQSVSYAALNLLITQESWIKQQRPRRRQRSNNESP
jgi:isochorismate hydrolase